MMTTFTLTPVGNGLIKTISKAVSKWRFVGSLARGEDQHEALEIVVIPKQPNKRLKGVIKRDWSDLTIDGDTWKTNIGSLPVILFIANQANFATKIIFKTYNKTLLNDLQNAAEKKNLTLTENGLYSDTQALKFYDPPQVFARLGVPYVSPEEVEVEV